MSTRKRKKIRQNKQQAIPYFQVGHKVQLKPQDRILTGHYLDRLHATITRIRELDPCWSESLSLEEWQEFRSASPVNYWTIWIKLDDFPELHDYYKHNEIPVRYTELRPLQPKMSKLQLLQYCEEHSLQAMKEQHKLQYDAYLGMSWYLKGEWPGFPLNYLNNLDLFIPNGYYIDFINRFISGANEIRKLAEETREKCPPNAEMYEAQAQVCDEICQLLIPKQHSFIYII